MKNLSLLWRHAWLSKQLKLKAEDWQTVLKILPQAVLEFPSPKDALDFLEKVDPLKASGFTPDELNWLLAADRSAKAATKETDAARFLLALRKELQSIQAENDPAQVPLGDVEKLTALLTSLLQKLNRAEPAAQLFLFILRDEVSQVKTVASLDPAFLDFPQAVKDAMRVRYDKDTKTVSFTGLMTATQRTTLLNDPSILAAVRGDANYQEAVEEFFISPRLALKFYEPVFTAPLANLPAAIDFKALPDPALAQKISYDAEQRLLRLSGILSKDEKAALDALSADVSYRGAVNSLFTQPASGIFPPEKLWVQDADLVFPLRDLTDPTNDNLPKNLATAATKALTYLSRTLSENAVVQQASAQLELTPAVARRLLTEYALLPDTLLST